MARANLRDITAEELNLAYRAVTQEEYEEAEGEPVTMKIPITLEISRIIGNVKKVLKTKNFAVKCDIKLASNNLFVYVVKSQDQYPYLDKFYRTTVNVHQGYNFCITSQHRLILTSYGTTSEIKLEGTVNTKTITNLPVLSSPNIIPSIKVGQNKQDCLILGLNWLFNAENDEVHYQKRVDSIVGDSANLANIFSAYFNIFLGVIPADIGMEIRDNLLLADAPIKLVAASEADIAKVANYKPLTNEVWGVCFLFLIAIAKSGDIEREHYKKWLEKRYKALAAALNLYIKDPPATLLESYFDVRAIAAVFETDLSWRKSVYQTVINAKDITCQHTIVLFDQAKMILEYYGLNTIKIAHDFAIAVETEAHTFRKICEQSDALIAAINTLNSDMKYHCLTNPHPSSLSISSYKDLVACALLDKSNMSKDESWKNYKVKLDEMNYPPYINAVNRSLMQTQGPTVTDQYVLNWLEQKGRRTMENAPTRGSALKDERIKELQEYMRVRFGSNLPL